MSPEITQSENKMKGGKSKVSRPASLAKNVKTYLSRMWNFFYLRAAFPSPSTWIVLLMKGYARMKGVC